MKKKVLLAIAALLLLVFVYQGSLAFFRKEKGVSTPISAKTLGIELIDHTDDTRAEMTAEGYTFKNVMPNDALHREVCVKNVKEKNLYVRITATRYWKDRDGKKVKGSDASLIQLVTAQPENWIILDDGIASNHELVYFYYKKPILPQDQSDNVIDRIVLSEDIKGEEYQEYQAYLHLQADAIQDVVAQEAILAEWGIEATFDKQGNITSIEEQ